MAADPATEVTIAPMEIGHLRAVRDLGHQVFDTSVKPYTSWSLTAIAEHLDRVDQACWVALHEDRVAGFVLGSIGFGRRPDWGYLDWIAVAPDSRGHGIAGRLVETCSKVLFDLGATEIVTEVEARNDASAGLMSSHGFAIGATINLFVRPRTP